MQHVHYSREQIRIFALANYIERLPDADFNMECWLHFDCRPSCIAAHAIWYSLDDQYLPEERKLDILKDVSIPETAARYLGVYGQSLRRLFTPLWEDLHEDVLPAHVSHNRVSQDERMRISKHWAAAVLRRLATTGEVDWIAAKRDMKASRPMEVAA